MRNRNKPGKVELVAGSTCTKFPTNRDFPLRRLLPLEILEVVPLEALAAEVVVDHLEQVNSFVACQNYFGENNSLEN